MKGFFYFWTMATVDIKFKSSYGEVRLLCLSGVDESFQIYINDYFQGMLFTRSGKWVSNLNKNSKLTPENIEKIVEIIKLNQKDRSSAV